MVGDLVTEDDLSSLGSNQQLKSPPNIREYEFKSGSEEKKRSKKLTSSKLGAYRFASATLVLYSLPETIIKWLFVSDILLWSSKGIFELIRMETPLALEAKDE